MKKLIYFRPKMPQPRNKSLSKIFFVQLVLADNYDNMGKVIWKVLEDIDYILFLHGPRKKNIKEKLKYVLMEKSKIIGMK